MWNDWPAIARKLPADYLEQDFRGNLVRVGDIVERYELTPRRDAETVVTIVGATPARPPLDVLALTYG